MSTNTHRSSLIRSRWAGIGAAIAVAIGAGGAGWVVHAGTEAQPASFVSITPCRLFDTRPAPDTVGDRPSPLGAGEAFERLVWGTNGNCTIPSTAVGISFNLTVPDAGIDGFMTIFPADAPRPASSIINPVAGAGVKSNGGVVGLSASGRIKLFTSRGPVDALLDINGYFVGSVSGLQGTAGPTGPQGPTGSIGPQGPNGPTGPAGPQGNVGLTGLKGDTGLQGPIGPAGADGTVGPTGPAGSLLCEDEVRIKTASPTFVLSVACEPPPPPPPPPPPTSSTQVAAGAIHSCALLADTTVKCWGNNYYGQLGNGTNTDSNTAVTVTGITGATAITAGYNHSCALLADTTIKCWGWNGNGPLGNGTYTDSNTAVTVTGITGAIAIAAGNSHSCALLADTTVKCWGFNEYGALGNGTNTNSNTAVTVTGITGATAITGGKFNHSCALLADTTIKCWGQNGSGELGNGTRTHSNTPVTVFGITGATAITAGDSHSCALLGDTTVKCWGHNGNGQLGNGTNNLTVPFSATAVTVTGITGATAITAGYYHSCALLADATVKCWGWNVYGQLGTGTNTVSNIAVTVTGLTGVTAIAAGYHHSCALLADTTVKCLGYNGPGQLGNGTNTDSNTPVSVIGL